MPAPTKNRSTKSTAASKATAPETDEKACAVSAEEFEALQARVEELAKKPAARNTKATTKALDLVKLREQLDELDGQATRPPIQLNGVYARSGDRGRIVFVTVLSGEIDPKTERAAQFIVDNPRTGRLKVPASYFDRTILVGSNPIVLG